MKNNFLKLIIIGSLILQPYILLCDNSVVGSKLLNLKSSARVNALGGYFTALNDDINAIEENPAGTTYVQSLAFNIYFSKWIADINYFNIKSIIPLKKQIPLNLLVTSTYVLYPSTPHYDETGLNMGSVDMSEGYMGLGLSSVLFHFIQTGIIFKYAYRSIYNEYYSSLVADMGIQMPYRFKKSTLTTGLSLKNIGYDFNQQKLPTTLLLGISYPFFNNLFLVKLDIGSDGLNNFSTVIDNMLYSAGLEYYLGKIIVFRGGLKYVRKYIYPTVGLGSQQQRFNGLNLYWAFDYSYNPLLHIQEYNNHQLSLNISFFTTEERENKNKQFEQYKKNGMVEYLKGNFSIAQDHWEKASQFGSSKELDKLKDKTEKIIDTGYIQTQKEQQVIFNIVEDRNELFASEDKMIKPKMVKVLNGIIPLIKEKDYKRIFILVYLPKEGQKQFGEVLAMHHAQSVSQYLIKQGVDPKRISYKGYEQSVVLSDETGNLISKNKLCEIIIMTWKKNEKESFNQYYFFGLDAFMKEAYREAIIEWEKALVIDPDNDDVKLKIKEAREKLKK